MLSVSRILPDWTVKKVDFRRLCVQKEEFINVEKIYVELDIHILDLYWHRDWLMCNVWTSGSTSGGFTLEKRYGWSIDVGCS